MNACRKIRATIFFKRYSDQGWMGWKRRGSNQPVELIFRFDSPRNFTRVDFFVSNRYDLGIKVTF